MLWEPLSGQRQRIAEESVYSLLQALHFEDRKIPVLGKEGAFGGPLNFLHKDSTTRACHDVFGVTAVRKVTGAVGIHSLMMTRNMYRYQDY